MSITNSFDYSIISGINHICGKSEIFDNAILFLTDSDLFKGCVVMTFYWFLWFSSSADITDKRQRIISTFYATFMAMFIARIMSILLNFRTRPILNPDNHLVRALGFDLNKIPDTHNSFPSDHATLFFALATGMYFISKRLGLVLFLYTILFIIFPRIYLGLHYPTDIIAGAFIGIMPVIVANMKYFRTGISAKILNYSGTHPAIFYSVFFFLTYQIGTLFDSSRAFLHFLGSLTKQL